MLAITVERKVTSNFNDVISPHVNIAMFSLLLILFQTWIQVRSGTVSLNNCDVKKGTTYEDAENMYARYTKRYTGKLSFAGDYPSGLTSCRMDPLPPISSSLGWIPVAVGPRDYVHSLMCGSCLKISPRKLKKRSLRKKRTMNFQFDPTSNYYATVVDECVHCKPGDVQMYREGSGVHDIIYEAVDCPEFLGEEGYMHINLKQCNDKRMKLQIKNTKLPTVSLELFQENKWKCMPKTIDNFFLLSPQNDTNTYSPPLKARATAITGQTLGFTIDTLKNKREVIIPAQYSPFDTVSSGKAPRLKCFAKSDTPSKTETETDEYNLKKSNMTIDDLHKLPNNVHLLTSNGHLLKSPEKTNKSNLTTHLISNNTATNFLNQTYNSPPSAVKTNAHVSPLFHNSTLKQGLQVLKFLKEIKLNKPPPCKFDGTHSVPNNCASFYICQEGLRTLKQCPHGLLFNPVEGVCDWPHHVTCARTFGSNYIPLKGPIMDDDDVYTKKFT